MAGFDVGYGAGRSRSIDNDIQQRLVAQERQRSEERYEQQQKEARQREADAKRGGTAQAIGKIGGGILGGLGGLALGGGNPMMAAMGASMGSGIGGGIAGIAAPGSGGQYAMQGAEGMAAGISPVMQYLMQQEMREQEEGRGGQETDPGDQGRNWGAARLGYNSSDGSGYSV